MVKYEIIKYEGQYESESRRKPPITPVDRRIPQYTAVKPLLQSKFSVYFILVAFL